MAQVFLEALPCGQITERTCSSQQCVWPALAQQDPAGGGPHCPVASLSSPTASAYSSRYDRCLQAASPKATSSQEPESGEGGPQTHARQCRRTQALSSWDGAGALQLPLGTETTKAQGLPSQQEGRGTTGIPPQERARPSHRRQSDTHTLGSPATATRPASQSISAGARGKQRAVSPQHGRLGVQTGTVPGPPTHLRHASCAGGSPFASAAVTHGGRGWGPSAFSCL